MLSLVWFKTPPNVVTTLKDIVETSFVEYKLKLKHKLVLQVLTKLTAVGTRVLFNFTSLRAVLDEIHVYLSEIGGAMEYTLIAFENCSTKMLG